MPQVICKLCFALLSSLVSRQTSQKGNFQMQVHEVLACTSQAPLDGVLGSVLWLCHQQVVRHTAARRVPIGGLCREGHQRTLSKSVSI